MATIWEKAKQFETEGRILYEQLAKEAPGKELAGAFTRLALEEERHYRLFDSLEKSMPVESAASAAVIADVPKFFESLARELRGNDTALKAVQGSGHAYRKALTMEKRSVEFYTQVLSQVEDAFQKAAVSQVISEEELHVKIFEGFLEFVREPRSWTEDAEFAKGKID